MRFERLRLLAFGHFTDAEIDLAGGPALHVFYGPNEAGKSTALRAITGLLYGIPATTTDAHLHAMPELRVGAVLSQNGTSLDVVRRKGNTNTLLDSDGRNPLPESTLLGMLGGVDESTFRAMFGLDHVALRHGAESLLRGGGSVGETLFDAGVSGRGIQRVLSELRREADELYRPRGQKQALNDALRRFKEAKKRRGQDSVAPDAWLTQRQGLDLARKESAAAAQRRRELVAEQNALQRALRVLPDLTKRRGLIARRDALGEVVRLDDEAATRREKAERQIAELERDRQSLSADLAELEKRRDSLQVSQTIAELDANLVEEIYGRLGQYRKAQADLPKRVAELKARESDVARLATSVGLDAVDGDFGRARVAVSTQARIDALAKRWVALATAADDLRGRVADCEAALAVATKHASEVGEPPPDDLSVLLDEAAAIAELPTRVAALEADMAELDKRVEVGLGRLSPWRRDVDALARIALPSAETIGRFERELDALDGAAAELARGRRDLDRRLAENERKRRAQEELGAVPTESDLREARARRDARWQEIKSDGGRGSEKRWHDFEHEIAESDEIADRLRREADRVATVAALIADAEYLDNQRAEAEARQDRLAEEREAWSTRWLDLWRSAGFDPSSPAEMRDWIGRVGETVGAAEKLARLTDERDRARQRVSRCIRNLTERAAKSGASIAAGASLAEATAAGRDLVERWARLRRDCDAASSAVEKAELDLARERRLLDEKEAQIVEWRDGWKKAVAELGLSGEVSTEEAIAVVGGMVELAARIDAADAIRARVVGIDLDIEGFRRDVEDLIAGAAPDLAGEDPAQAAERLFRVHRQTMNALENRREVESSIEKRRAALRDVEDARQAAEDELAALMARAGVDDLEALRRAEARSEEAARLAASIAEIEGELLASGEGADIDELLEETRGVDVDGARARLGDLAEEIETLGDEIDRLGRDVGSMERGLEVLENELGAADAAAEEQQSLADLDARVRRYVRVRLAAELLESEVERYRQQNQGPILTRANSFFPRLTLGRYRELRVGYDAKDEEVLRCVRDDGSEVDIDALSDGTRDQLYLALRLATLEHFAETHDPLPLILDDVFIHFDDPRTKAALDVLGSFAETTQILLFTHHARLVELAREVVPDERRVEHDLSKLSVGSGD